MSGQFPMEELVDDSSIGDDQLVFRRVRSDEFVFDKELNRFRPSTQAFLQDGPNGPTSVYLTSETTPGAVSAEGDQSYLVVVPVGMFREMCLGIARTSPENAGPGHCDIIGRKTRGILHRVVCQAAWVPGYGPEQQVG
jgi:hypothetical protein